MTGFLEGAEDSIWIDLRSQEGAKVMWESIWR